MDRGLLHTQDPLGEWSHAAPHTTPGRRRATTETRHGRRAPHPEGSTLSKPQYRGHHLSLRQAWVAELTRTGGRRCACRGQCGHHHGRCPTIIRPGEPWDLMHKTPAARGGTSHGAEPGCPACNRAEGAKIRDGAASEDWW